MMPKINLPDKVCSHCGGTLWYYKPSSSNYLTCFEKRREDHKKEYEMKKNDPVQIDKKKIWMKNWRNNNSEHVRKYKLSYDKTDKGRSAKRKRSHYAIDQLRDCYIKSILLANSPVKLSKEDIPQELVEIERKNLILKREMSLTTHKRQR